MSTDVSPAVVEQLRVLDGHLFQDEKVLSVYLDTKSFVWTYLCSLLRSQNDPSEQIQWKDTFAANLVNTFHNVRPSIEKDLYEVVKKQSEMLGHQRDSVIATPHVSKYLQGIFRRILQHDSYTSRVMLEYDPIKVDFVFREAFRSCLQNDCLTLFEMQVPSKIAEQVDAQQESNFETKEVIPNQAMETKEIQEQASQDSGSDESSVAKSVVGPLASSKSVAGNTQAKSIVDGSASVAAKSIAKGPSSVVSKAMSAITSVSTIKKPKVKTVFLQDDDAISRFTKITSRQ